MLLYDARVWKLAGLLTDYLGFPVHSSTRRNSSSTRASKTYRLYAQFFPLNSFQPKCEIRPPRFNNLPQVYASGNEELYMI